MVHVPEVDDVPAVGEEGREVGGERVGVEEREWEWRRESGSEGE